MKKLTKQSLDEMAKAMQMINKMEQETIHILRKNIILF